MRIGWTHQQQQWGTHSLQFLLRDERAVPLHPSAVPNPLSSPCCACMGGLCYPPSMGDRATALPSHKPRVTRPNSNVSNTSFTACYKGLQMKEKFTMVRRFCHDWKCNDKNIAGFFLAKRSSQTYWLCTHSAKHTQQPQCAQAHIYCHKTLCSDIKALSQMLTLTAPESSRIIVKVLEMRKLDSVTIQLHTTLTYSASWCQGSPPPPHVTPGSPHDC